MRIEGRLNQIERKLGIDANEDKPFVLEVASGQRFITTRRQVRGIFEGLWRSNSRHLSKGAYDGQSIEAS